ncbi:flavoprotein [Brachybacterium phenoliresistens]|uniref:Flavoprotein n=1 Tax=Brachybacterium phenoliresistens TaxID=396014 RepID=Z9JPE9_9MICO|nr:CE1759 family FMN reductase [Brachybacterium phenoliresistens]EWS80029.1 flavoprotein [Brachybacterium phenoliresistens]
MTQPLRLVVLTAGLSTPSSTRMLADQLADAAVRRAEAAGRCVTTTVVELRELAREITDALLTRFPGERLARVLEDLRAADAVIAVTPVFNVGPSGLFKMFVDVADREIWEGKPLLLGATAGTARHSLAVDYALRPMFSYLKAEVVPTAVFAASADFGAADAPEADAQPLAARARRAAGELLTLLGAAGSAAAGAARTEEDQAGETTPVDPIATGEFADFVPMGTLLGR